MQNSTRKFIRFTFSKEQPKSCCHTSKWCYHTASIQPPSHHFFPLVSLTSEENGPMKTHLVPAFLIASAISGTAYGSTTVSGVQIVDFGTYGNGNIYITLDKTIDEPGCPSIYMELPADGPATKNAFAILAIAFSSGAKVNIKTDGCYNGVPSFTGGRNTIFTLRKP